MPKPFFISLDGLDGTGKTTQLNLLAETLRSEGRTVTIATDPGGTELGAKLREILLFGRQNAMANRTEALLFMASRAELIEKVIRPALHRGEIVLSDRFLLANVVYQGHAGGLEPQDLWNLGHFCTAGIQPDLILLLDLPVEVAKARRKPGAADRVESRGDDYFEKVRSGFLMEAAQCPDTIRVVSADGSVEEVRGRIEGEVKSALANLR